VLHTHTHYIHFLVITVYLAIYTVKKITKCDAGAQPVGVRKFRHPRMYRIGRAAQSMWMTTDFSDLSIRE
jgi:hypothetical protein